MKNDNICAKFIHIECTTRNCEGGRDEWEVCRCCRRVVGDLRHPEVGAATRMVENFEKIFLEINLHQ